MMFSGYEQGDDDEDDDGLDDCHCCWLHPDECTCKTCEKCEGDGFVYDKDSVPHECTECDGFGLIES